MAGLNEKQKRFAREYLVDLNAAQAAIRAGYSKRTARQQGQRLLTNADIQALIEKGNEKRAEKTEITAERVLEELGILAFSDIRNYLTFQADGTVVLDWSDMPKEATRAIAEITVDEYTDGKGEDDRPVRKTKFKLYNKQPALDALAKHLGVLIERHEHTGKDGGPIKTEDASLDDNERVARLAAILDAARARRDRQDTGG